MIIFTQIVAPWSTTILLYTKILLKFPERRSQLGQWSIVHKTRPPHFFLHAETSHAFRCVHPSAESIPQVSILDYIIGKHIHDRTDISKQHNVLIGLLHVDYVHLEVR